MARRTTTKKPATTRKPKTKSGAPGTAGVKPPPGPGHNEPPARTDDEIRASFNQHRTSWNNWKAKQAVVDKIELDTKAALKADGFTVKQMQIADDLLTLKGEKKITTEVTDRLKVARWIGHPMGAQMDLFEQPDRTPSVDRAYDQGKQASMENQPRKPPYAPDLPQYQSWMDGYNADQERLAGGIKQKPVDGDETTSRERVSRSEFQRRLGDMTKSKNGAPIPKDAPAAEQ